MVAGGGWCGVSCWVATAAFAVAAMVDAGTVMAVCCCCCSATAPAAAVIGTISAVLTVI